MCKKFKVFLSLFVVFCMSFTFIPAAMAGGSVEQETPVADVQPAAVSDDGMYTLVTSPSYSGLALVNNSTGKTTVITDGLNAGYYATIAPDNSYVCFKAFKENGDSYLQTAMLYDISKNRNIALNTWTSLAGTPAVAPDGTIAYTVENTLYVTDSKLKAADKYSLGYHVNLVAFSPDSKSIALNNQNEQIVILNLTDKSQKVVSDGKASYWGPKFSPDGSKLLTSTVEGSVVCANLVSGESKVVGKGEAANWVDSETVAFVEKTVAQYKVTKSELVLANTASGAVSKVELNAGDAVAAVKGNNVAVARSGKLEKAQLVDKKAVSGVKKLETAKLPTVERKIVKMGNKDGTISQAVVNDGTKKYLSGVPCIHQVYDTENAFNGNWACNATAALMAIQYYGVLGTHPITVSIPYSHTSNYGWYISEPYTKGITYNIYSPDASGVNFAGGYGYIVRNNWADTKGYMADYINYHGRSSSVDWSPTWEKIQTEITNNHPFVVLTSLTTAGHYITCIGYFLNQHTGYFNDPYGDKNYTYMNYQGYNSSYDWPGYNNGYSNLTTVHCYIWCR